MSERPSFLLVDGHALIYRAFYAFPKLTSAEGILVNAVYGFSRILLTAIRQFSPVYAAVAFDHPSKTFRHTDFAEYKGKRPEMPDELKPQIPLIKEVVSALNIPKFEIPGFEADDIIGTISRLLEEGELRERTHAADLLTVIITGDKDTLQLVDHDTNVWLPGRAKGQSDQLLDSDAVREKLGVLPTQVIELKALMGDSSDNIPGVKGIGPKTASTLVQQYGTIEKLYESIESANGPSSKIAAGVLAKLKADKEMAFLSKQLATIDCHVPMEFDLESCRVSSYDKAAVQTFFRKLDFESLNNMLPADEFEDAVQAALF